ncbi:hypothetical protein J8F10_20950 [Gemmata sp. G18]|uniref:Zinc ribbon domain-containing protein n=1 Tax=Gemmata palustris TaxID=2822762 RepID=A0ABS5BVH5_9BACT|nr:hypothetical protein [Gemmata palustris]MBP3957727.1 hypothetical protein [Gemmata palustris]
MPFIVTCPTCHQALTVHEMTAGQAVGCPHCRQPLTVPAPVTKAPDPPELEFSTGPVTKRYSTRSKYHRNDTGSGVKLLFICAAVAVAVSLVVGAAWYFARPNPEIARVEAEYSEVCDELDRMKKAGVPEHSEQYNRVFRRWIDLQIQFNNKYGRTPRHLKYEDRDYSTTPIR